MLYFHFVLAMFTTLEVTLCGLQPVWGRVMIRSRVATVSFAALLASSSVGAAAQDRRQNTPGEFDFYVLALSWSPSFCEASAERAARRESNGKAARPAAHQQCGERPFRFVVHGLWPQYENGFPEYCQVPAPRLDRNIVGSMLDLMPATAPRLSRVGQARHLFRPVAARLLRHGAQGARRGEDSRATTWT